MVGYAVNPLGQKAAAKQASGPLADCPHPRCQAESLPPPSPPIRIPAAPPHERASGHAGGATGDPARPECRRRANPGQPPGRRALIHAAKLSPYRRHHRQAASLPPPLTSGAAGRRAGPQAIPIDRNAGDERTPAGPWRASPHPHCQSSSLWSLQHQAGLKKAVGCPNCLAVSAEQTGGSGERVRGMRSCPSQTAFIRAAKQEKRYRKPKSGPER